MRQIEAAKRFGDASSRLHGLQLPKGSSAPPLSCQLSGEVIHGSDWHVAAVPRVGSDALARHFPDCAFSGIFDDDP